MFAFDPLYLLFAIPPLLLGLWAQHRVKAAYMATDNVPVRSGVSGAEAAARLLMQYGVRDVRITEVPGVLTDHYDPRNKVLGLSAGVFRGRSLAAVGIAAHEAGHAVQHATGYLPLKLRNGIVGLAAVGNIGIYIAMAGLMLGGLAKGGFGGWLVLAGVGLFAMVVLFQLINLPVEFDASARAKAMLVDAGVARPEEMPQVRSVLSAAALTYVAATLSAIGMLLYLLVRAMGQSQQR